MADPHVSNHGNDHVLHERHGTSNASKVPLLSYDMFPVRLWRHLVQRFRRRIHADVRVQPVVVLLGSRALSAAHHRLSEHALLHTQLVGANSLRSTVPADETLLAVRTVRCSLDVHHVSGLRARFRLESERWHNGRARRVSYGPFGNVLSGRDVFRSRLSATILARSARFLRSRSQLVPPMHLSSRRTAIQSVSLGLLGQSRPNRCDTWAAHVRFLLSLSHRSQRLLRLRDISV